VGARHVIFGHTHRAGPLPGDIASEWQTAGGISMLNTGSWVHDPSWVGERPAGPYRPGFAALVRDDDDPRLINLLDQA
jgi:hypothetical protein